MCLDEYARRFVFTSSGIGPSSEDKAMSGIAYWHWDSIPEGGEYF